MSEKKMSKKESEQRRDDWADAPSRNPDFKGATPIDVARALWNHRPKKSSQKDPKK